MFSVRYFNLFASLIYTIHLISPSPKFNCVLCSCVVICSIVIHQGQGLPSRMGCTSKNFYLRRPILEWGDIAISYKLVGTPATLSGHFVPGFSSQSTLPVTSPDHHSHFITVITPQLAQSFSSFTIHMKACRKYRQKIMYVYTAFCIR